MEVLFDQSLFYIKNIFIEFPASKLVSMTLK